MGRQIDPTLQALITQIQRDALTIDRLMYENTNMAGRIKSGTLALKREINRTHELEATLGECLTTQQELAEKFYNEMGLGLLCPRCKNRVRYCFEDMVCSWNDPTQPHGICGALLNPDTTVIIPLAEMHRLLNIDYTDIMFVPSEEAVVMMEGDMKDLPGRPSCRLCPALRVVPGVQDSGGAWWACHGFDGDESAHYMLIIRHDHNLAEGYCSPKCPRLQRMQAGDDDAETREESTEATGANEEADSPGTDEGTASAEDGEQQAVPPERIPPPEAHPAERGEGAVGQLLDAGEGDGVEGHQQDPPPSPGSS